MRITTFRSTASRMGGDLRERAPELGVADELAAIQAQGLERQANITRSGARRATQDAAAARRVGDLNLREEERGARAQSREARLTREGQRQTAHAVSQAAAFVERKVEQRRQLDRARTQLEFAGLQQGIEADLTKAAENADLGAEGLHDTFMSGKFRERTTAFMQNVPNHLREEYEMRAAMLRERTSMTAASAENKLRNDFYKDSINTQVGGLVAQLVQNPSSALEYEKDIHAQIADTSLPALDKLKMSRRASIEIRQAAIKGLVERGMFMEARAIAVAEPSFVIQAGNPAQYRANEPHDGTTVTKETGATNPDHAPAIEAFAEKAGGKSFGAEATSYIVGAVKAIFGAWGSPGEGNLKARTFLNYGTPVPKKKPELGDIVVSDRGDPRTPGAHVGIYAGNDDSGNLLVVGGNANGGARRTAVKPSRVLDVRRPPNANTEANTTLFGGASNPTGAVLADYAEDLIKQKGRSAGERKRELRRQTLDLIKDDLSSIENTGQGVETLTEEAVARVLGPERAAGWIVDRSLAQNYHRNTNDFVHLPNDEMQERLRALRPEPGANYRSAQHYYDKAVQLADNIMQERTRDPAASVDRTPEVQAMLRNVDPRQPESMEAVVDARLAAQERIGIEQPFRAPITKHEAKTLTHSLLRANPVDRARLVDNLIHTVDHAFGEHANDVLTFTIAETVRDDEIALQIVGAWRRFQRDQALPVADAQAMDDTADASRAERFAGDGFVEPADASEWTGAEFGEIPPRRDVGLAPYLRQPRRATDEQGNPEIIPPYQAIQAVIQDPRLVDEFVKKYGEKYLPPQLQSTRE